MNIKTSINSHILDQNNVRVKPSFARLVANVLEQGEITKDELRKVIGTRYLSEDNNVISIDISPKKPLLSVYTNNLAEIADEKDIDILNDVSISEPLKNVDEIRLNITLAEIKNKYQVATYEVEFNGATVLKSEFSAGNNLALISYINFAHPALSDNYETEWFELEFEQGTPMHSSLIKKAKTYPHYQTSIQEFIKEYGSLDGLFSDDGYQSKLDMCLERKTVAIYNNNSALPSAGSLVEINQFYESNAAFKSYNDNAIEALLTDIMVTPINLLLNELTA